MLLVLLYETKSYLTLTSTFIYLFFKSNYPTSFNVMFFCYQAIVRLLLLSQYLFDHHKVKLVLCIQPILRQQSGQRTNSRC